MTVWFVTGKLGSGKTLFAVSKIRERLLAGAPVATNLNLRLDQLVGAQRKSTRVIRLPDKPSLDDLESIGIGNTLYDESKNGLLVLDECGTWFNSRSWGDKERQGVINWFLHARKYGWDIIFLVQNISIVDKQARESLAEHVVYCRRTDRANIPFIGAIFKLLTMTRLPMPKVHLGIVRYGSAPTSLKVDTWTVFAPPLYRAYDTKQVFSDFYDDGVFSYLPPWHTHGRFSVARNLVNSMRITKIYFRKWSRVLAFALGVVGTAAVFFYHDYRQHLHDSSSGSSNTVATTPPLSTAFSGYAISGYWNLPGQLSDYLFVDSHGVLVRADVLRKKGYFIKDRGSCEALIVKGKDYVSIFCG